MTEHTTNNRLYIKIMGLFFLVTSLHKTVEEANAHMASHPNEAVIAERDGITLLADKGTMGISMK